MKKASNMYKKSINDISTNFTKSLSDMRSYYIFNVSEVNKRFLEYLNDHKEYNKSVIEYLETVYIQNKDENFKILKDKYNTINYNLDTQLKISNSNLEKEKNKYLDILLDKVKYFGFDNLTDFEKDFLNKYNTNP